MAGVLVVLLGLVGLMLMKSYSRQTNRKIYRTFWERIEKTLFAGDSTQIILNVDQISALEQHQKSRCICDPLMKLQGIAGIKTGEFSGWMISA